MRTVTTEDNPYKVAGDILFASSEVESDFRSVDLYGSSVRRKKEDAICSRFHLENESGTGDIAVYQTFPGMELVYNDMHMEYCNKMQSPRPGFIEINYCQALYVPEQYIIPKIYVGQFHLHEPYKNPVFLQTLKFE